ncbi:MAG: glycosyltransferase [Solirubrobacterales bacterium]
MREEPSRGPRLSVIVPATDRPATIRRSTEAIEAELDDGDELIVVTEPDGDGPAAARNTGAAIASGEVIVFVDADVVVHRGGLGRIRSAFAGDDSLVALFGSYDDSPEAPGAVSGFRNLLHHHVHQSAAGPAATFWAGLGAMRRDAFVGAGGFDAERFPAPSVEDIELGIRLARGGERVVLDRALQGTHLKAWTLAEMVHTDLVRRGIPWIGILLQPGAPRGALNLGWRHRLSAAATLLAVGAIAARRPRPAAIAALCLIALNRSLYALVWRRRGAGEAFASVGLHAIHHLTGIVAVLAGVLLYLWNRHVSCEPASLSPTRKASGDASSRIAQGHIAQNHIGVDSRPSAGKFSSPAEP